MPHAACPCICRIMKRIRAKQMRGLHSELGGTDEQCLGRVDWGGLRNGDLREKMNITLICAAQQKKKHERQQITNASHLDPYCILMASAASTTRVGVPRKNERTTTTTTKAFLFCNHNPFSQLSITKTKNHVYHDQQHNFFCSTFVYYDTINSDLNDQQNYVVNIDKDDRKWWWW